MKQTITRQVLAVLIAGLVGIGTIGIVLAQPSNKAEKTETVTGGGGGGGSSLPSNNILVTAIVGAVTAFFAWRTQTGRIKQLSLEKEGEERRRKEEEEKVVREKQRAEDAENQQKAEADKAIQEKKRAEGAEEQRKAEAERAAQEKSRAEEAVRLKEESARAAAEAHKRAEMEREAAAAARRDKEAFVKGIDLPKPAPPGHRRCSMILLGIGGVGKTTFLEKCFHWQAAAAQGKTLVVETLPTDIDFSAKAKELGLAKDGTRVTCWVTDYVGQNLGTLIRYFVEQQKVVESPVAYGHINVLCVMVDLKKPLDYDYDVKVGGEEELIEVAKPRLKRGEMRLSPETSRHLRNGGPDPNPGKPDADRIKLHIDKWNDQSLNAVFGLLTTGSLRRVFIFVNKVDLIDDQSPGRREEYERIFEPLRKRLSERFNQGEVEVILGSSLKGDGHPAVRQLIFESADPASS